MADQQELDYAAFLATLDRVRAGKDKEFNPRPAFDAKLAKEAQDDRTQGRKIEDYHQALEYLGWRFFTARELTLTFGVMAGETGPILHSEGEWRNMQDAARWPELRMAFKSRQIVEFFQGPQDFYEWYVTARTKERAKAAGIFLPPGLVLA